MDWQCATEADLGLSAAALPSSARHEATAGMNELPGSRCRG